MCGFNDWIYSDLLVPQGKYSNIFRKIYYYLTLKEKEHKCWFNMKYLIALGKSLKRVCYVGPFKEVTFQFFSHTLFVFLSYS